jgi:glycosyltransferase involved in cell wall biosynthesis
VSSVSVLILTKNEAQDLPGCLESVAWCDDVHVLDSGSDDDTCDIAAQRGAHVARKSYADSSKIFGGDEAAHRNWSLRNTPFKYPWVFLLDADERVTADLAQAILVAVQAPGEHVAFRVRRRDFLLNTWLKHVQASPYYLRLFRPEKLRYERLINPVTIADGPVGELLGYLDHYPFSKGTSYWLSRHNAYSTLEAQQIAANRRGRIDHSWWRAFTSRDFHERRFHQKELFYRLPLRPLAKFVILYILKGGFLDGRAGFRYAVLQAFYEYMIVLKVKELAARETAP